MTQSDSALLRAPIGTPCRYSDFMPSNERVSQLLALDELPTLQEFIDTYESSEEATSMSEVVWPAEPTLAY